MDIKNHRSAAVRGVFPGCAPSPLDPLVDPRYKKVGFDTPDLTFVTRTFYFQDIFFFLVSHDQTAGESL